MWALQTSHHVAEQRKWMHIEIKTKVSFLCYVSDEHNANECASVRDEYHRNREVHKSPFTRSDIQKKKIKNTNKRRKRASHHVTADGDTSPQSPSSLAGTPTIDSITTRTKQTGTHTPKRRQRPILALQRHHLHLPALLTTEYRPSGGPRSGSSAPRGSRRGACCRPASPSRSTDPPCSRQCPSPLRSPS